MQRSPKAFKANLQSDLISFTTHDNRNYLVAPCVALVPGVLNGELVTLSAVSTSCDWWNGRPVVINHPYDENGVSISANKEPEIIEKSGIGHVQHADVDDNKLRVQVWIDIDKATRLGGDALHVLNSVKSGAPLEVSTGYWAFTKESRGTHNQTAYHSVTELIIPDHLAMLPNDTGACSWGDGCGIPRTMKAREMDEDTIISTIKNTLKSLIPGFTQKMTVSDKFQALRTLIGQEMEAEGIDIWNWHMVDIEDNYVIIGMKDMFQRRPFIDTEGGNVQLSGEWETVYQQTTFSPVTNKACSCGGPKVKAEKPWPAPPSEHVIDNADPEQEPELEPEHEQEELPEDSQEQEEDEVNMDTLQEFLAQHGVTQEQLVANLQEKAAHRQGLIAVIKANSTLTDQDLQGVSDAVVETMASSFTAKQQQPAPVYDMRGLPVEQPVPLQVKKLARRKPLLDKSA